jgi:alpha/beta superfamily hydrolase
VTEPRPALRRAQAVTIDGPAGALQGLLEIPPGPGEQVRHFGVVCHPHPLMGGTMDNKVVYTVSRAFQDAGAPTIRFNFRGVGRSQGEHEGGVGEMQDALAAIAHGRALWPGAGLWLAGFSFGGAVALRAAAPAGAARLVTVAPALSRVTGPEFPWPACPWLVVQGDADDVVNPGEVLALGRRVPAPQITVLAGAGHFFHGFLPALRLTVAQFLQPDLAA